MKTTLIATSVFGLESVVKREVKALGFTNICVTDGKIEFDATVNDICKANIWLRCADRVLWKFGEFNATTFDALFDQTIALPWHSILPKDAAFTVIGKSVKSTLGSIRACQAIVKKAIAKNLQEAYKINWCPETGPAYTIQIAMLNDIATLTLDTSGTGLHKRGYRMEGGDAPLKETLAAGLIQLSQWDPDTLLIDPMCGSGTIPLEAAMIAKNIAPGLRRHFASEHWDIIPPKSWKDAREHALNAIEKRPVTIFGSDISALQCNFSNQNCKNLLLHDEIFFEQKDIKDLWIDQQYGTIITNPPYGIRLSDFKEMNDIYISLHKTFKKKMGWNVYVLTADEKFPDYFKRSYPTKVRKLYNGRIKTYYYQYFS